MKTLLKSLKITLAFCVFFSVFYILILWLFAQVAGPNKGNAEVVTLNGKVVGAANVGQMFTKDMCNSFHLYIRTLGSDIRVES